LGESGALQRMLTESRKVIIVLNVDDTERVSG